LTEMGSRRGAKTDKRDPENTVPAGLDLSFA
jgi:hypothetical protein